MLHEMQMRISQGPHSALSVADTASAEDVRAAFLHLTKQFHPARFGRMSPEIHRLANEVFLGIKSAHDLLTKQLGSSGRATSTGVITTELTRPGTMPGGTQRGTGLIPRASTPQLARGTDRASHRSPSPSPSPFGARSTTSRPLTTPPSGSRATTPNASTTQPIPRSAPHAGTPPSGVTVRLGTPPGEAQRAGSAPIAPARDRARDTSGSATRETVRRASTPSGSPVRPSTRMQAVRPGTPPPPSADAINPPTIRYSGVQPAQPASRVFDEQAELRTAMDMLAAKNFAAARQAFHALAAKIPQSRHYRALLCYARGRETAASGRIDDAVMEFQRALQLDSELEIAKQAIRELGRKSRW